MFYDIKLGRKKVEIYSGIFYACTLVWMDRTWKRSTHVRHSKYVLLPFLLTQSLCFLNFMQLLWRDNSNIFSTNDNHRKLVKLGLNHSKLPNQSRVIESFIKKGFISKIENRCNMKTMLWCGFCQKTECLWQGDIN